MDSDLTREEVAILIRGRKILKARGLSKDVDVSTICQAAGISRKTGYQWAENLIEATDDQKEAMRQELIQVRAEHEALKKRYDDVCFENRGRKLAWEIHGVDELLAAKKNTTVKKRREKP